MAFNDNNKIKVEFYVKHSHRKKSCWLACRRFLRLWMKITMVTSQGRNLSIMH